jgi:hypothetical protein
MYGVTRTNLVRINPDNPSQVTVVGPHSIASIQPGLIPFGPLTYDPATARLYGIGIHPLPSPANDNFAYSLVSFDRTTGSASLVAQIGNHIGGNPPQALEYVNTRQSLVMSRGTPANPPLNEQLVDLALNGTQTLITTTPGHDSDVIVHDSQRDYFYVADPNLVGQLIRVQLPSGTQTNLGALQRPTMDEMAYSAARDTIFAVDFTSTPTSATFNRLYRINRTNGLAPISVDNVGNMGGDQVLGIAFAIIPEPASIILLATVATFVLHYRSRSRWLSKLTEDHAWK